MLMYNHVIQCSRKSRGTRGSLVLKIDNSNNKLIYYIIIITIMIITVSTSINT